LAQVLNTSEHCHRLLQHTSSQSILSSWHSNASWNIHHYTCQWKEYGRCRYGCIDDLSKCKHLCMRHIK
jgi:hypothetical protein